MVNRYLEKVAGWTKGEIGLTAGSAILGGGIGYLPGTEKRWDNKKQKYEDVKLTKKERAVNALMGGTLMGGIVGLHIHGDKIVRNAGNRAGEYWQKKDPRGFNSFRQRWYEEQARYHNANFTRHAMGSVDDHLKTFGTSKGHFKTKAEASRFFKTELHKHHPDKHQGANAAAATKKFQDLSVARDNILKSDWFEKLAALKNKYLHFLL